MYRNDLPETCLSVIATTGQLIIIKKGERGYYPSDWDTGDKAQNREIADFHPNLNDADDDLMRQKEPAAHDIALALELFTTGTLRNLLPVRTECKADHNRRPGRKRTAFPKRKSKPRTQVQSGTESSRP